MLGVLIHGGRAVRQLQRHSSVFGIDEVARGKMAQ